MFGKMKIFLMITAFFAVSFVYAEDPVIDEGPLSVNSFCFLEEGGSVHGGINSEFIYSELETGCLPFTESIEDRISKVRESLKDVTNFYSGWRKSLRAKNPGDSSINDANLDNLLIQYKIRPQIIDWMVDFPPWVSEGTVVTPPPPPQM